MQACVISIGDELLIGQTVNTNAAWIGEKLGEIGAELRRVVTIGDDAEEIRTVVDEATAAFEATIVTGGLGPTHDDITKKVVTELFGGTLVFHEDILERLRQYFAARGYALPATNESQAWLPDNADILPNKVGSAQGMLFRRNGHFCFVLPGVPREMKFIMQDSILPMLQQQQKGRTVLHFTWRTAGIPESRLAEMLDNVREIEPYGKIAFLPKYTGVDVRFSTVAESPAEAEARKNAAQKLILDKIGKYVFATGTERLEETAGKLLRQRSATLAVAESCTGGLICHKITSIPGSSDYFLAGVVAYSNAQKEKSLGVSADTLREFGAVSEQTAKEMAAGVRARAGSSYGLSVTGIAGPAGGTPDKPVGTVYIGLATPAQVTARKFHFGRDRAINQERSATAALLMLLLALKKTL